MIVLSTDRQHDHSHHLDCGGIFLEVVGGKEAEESSALVDYIIV